MIITLNSFTINDGSTGAWLESVQGLELPTIRTSTGNLAGKDGGYVGAQFFSARNITLTGRVFSSNVVNLEAARSQFQNALLGGSITMNITTNGGNQYTMAVKVLDFQMPIDKNVFQATYKLELLATDPIIYVQGSNQTITLAPLNPGGFTWPPVWPIVYAGGSSPTSIVNPGAVSVWPVITLNGTMNNPILTNQTTNLFMGLTLTTGPSDSVVINMAAHTITLNGANIFGDQTSGSTFWFLQPGSNSISLTTANITDTVTAQVQWQAGVMGI